MLFRWYGTLGSIQHKVCFVKSCWEGVSDDENSAWTQLVLPKLGAVCYNAQVATPKQCIGVVRNLTGSPVVVQVWADLLKEMK